LNHSLDNIPGQQKVKLTLNNFLQTEKIPHALLFSGMEGVGKDNAAIQFAKTIIKKTNLSGSEKINKAIEQLQEPYVKLIIPLPRGKNETGSSSPTEKLTQDDIELIREELETKSINPFHKISIPKANNIRTVISANTVSFCLLKNHPISHISLIMGNSNKAPMP